MKVKANQKAVKNVEPHPKTKVLSEGEVFVIIVKFMGILKILVLESKKMKEK
jgi:hypothetical protein